MSVTEDLTPEEKLVCVIFRKSAERHFLSSEGCQAVNKALDSLMLDSRCPQVIRLRFGFIPRTSDEKEKRPGTDSRTLEEVGREFGVTRERIRQIEVKALRRLRHSSRRRLLWSHIPHYMKEN